MDGSTRRAFQVRKILKILSELYPKHLPGYGFEPIIEVVPGLPGTHQILYKEFPGQTDSWKLRLRSKEVEPLPEDESTIRPVLEEALKKMHRFLMLRR